jgi:acetyltransferase EpsM
MHKIVLLGATGGCVDILDTILDINAAAPKPSYDVLGFLDDRAELQGTEVLAGARVIGPFSAAQDHSDCLFVTGIGSPYNYWRRGDVIDALGLAPERFATIVHPRASISSSARLGFGTVIHQNATVTTGAKIGNHVLVLPNAVISHGDEIGDFTIVNAGVCMGGDVRIGRSCYLGARSAVRQNVTIGDRSQIGMGSVVLNDVAPGAVVVGNPARFLRNIADFP